MTTEINKAIEGHTKEVAMDFLEWCEIRTTKTPSGYIIDGVIYQKDSLYEIFESEKSGKIFSTLPLSIPELCGVNMKSKSRERNLVVNRQIAVSLMYVFSTMSFHEIGRIFDKNHATLLHSIHCIDNAFACNDPLVMPLLKKAFTKLYSEFRKYAKIKNSHEAETIQTRLNKYDFSRGLIQQHKKI